MKRMAMRLALAMLALAPGAALAQAQSLLVKPIHIVVPYTAGGSVDIITRAVTQRLNAMWGQSVVIENKAGGGTQIGAGRRDIVRHRDGDLRDHSVHALQAVLRS